MDNNSLNQMFTRVPIVSRLEYLEDFLHCMEKGFDQTQTEHHLSERKRSFEEEKYKALGRGKILKKNLSNSRHLLRECFVLSEQLGFTLESRITKEGENYLLSGPEKQRVIFANKFLSSYQHAIDLILLLRSNPSHEITVPTNHNKEGGNNKEGLNFKRKAEEIGLAVNVVGFMTLRQLLSQIEITNWFPLVERDQPFWRVYLTSEILEGDANNSDKTSFTFDGKRYLIQPRVPEYRTVRDTIWNVYLEITDYIPYRPVFYSQLRSEVCYRLKISDRTFDCFTKKLLQETDDTLTVISASGNLPYDRDAASLLKSLPPRSADGRYLIFLKIKKKRQAS